MHIYRKMEKQIDKQTNMQIDRQTNMHSSGAPGMS